MNTRALTVECSEEKLGLRVRQKENFCWAQKSGIEVNSFGGVRRGGAAGCVIGDHRRVPRQRECQRCRRRTWSASFSKEPLPTRIRGNFSRSALISEHKPQKPRWRVFSRAGNRWNMVRLASEGCWTESRYSDDVSNVTLQYSSIPI